MPTVPSDAQARRAALDLLLSRQSRWPLLDPAPGAEDMALVFDAALRAPDHGQLRPWRFVVVRGEARHALGELFVDAARVRDPGGDPERFRAKALAAPLIVALGAQLRAGHKVPEGEQSLAVGAATMNMLNALHMLGYGGFWASGVNSYDPNVRAGLGFQPDESLIGFLYVGTPEARLVEARRPASGEFVRNWP